MSYADSASYKAWIAYNDHTAPIAAEAARPFCSECLHADDPSKGCETGILLWGAYRLAAIKDGAQV